MREKLMTVIGLTDKQAGQAIAGLSGLMLDDLLRFVESEGIVAKKATHAAFESLLRGDAIGSLKDGVSFVLQHMQPHSPNLADTYVSPVVEPPPEKIKPTELLPPQVVDQRVLDPMPSIPSPVPPPNYFPQTGKKKR